MKTVLNTSLIPFKTNAAKVAVAIGGVLLAAASHAADIAAVQTELAEGKTNVETIGAAVLLIAVVVAVFKYVKKAF